MLRRTPAIYEKMGHSKQYEGMRSHTKTYEGPSGARHGGSWGLAPEERSFWRTIRRKASLVPAAAVIPAPMVYFKVVAVKFGSDLLVGRKVGIGVEE
jgi:hypothetical protein